MSDFRGTPGPWVADELDVFACNKDGHICTVTEWVDEDMEEANACLIAAAPELLEALLETVKDLVAYQVNATHAAKINSRWEGCAEAVQPSIDAARAAICKALGQ